MAGMKPTFVDYDPEGTKRVQRIEELERQAAEDRAAINILVAALGGCSLLFADIRGDWTDPRSQCRQGSKLVGEALDKAGAAIARATQEPER
jgi:hypothetical protein